MKKTFWSRMVDSTDRTVEPHIVMMCWSVVAIIICAILIAWLKPEVFSFAGMGAALGTTIGVGGGLGAAGQGLQSRITPMPPPDHQEGS